MLFVLLCVGRRNRILPLLLRYVDCLRKREGGEEHHCNSDQEFHQSPLTPELRGAAERLALGSIIRPLIQERLTKDFGVSRALLKCTLELHFFKNVLHSTAALIVH